MDEKTLQQSLANLPLGEIRYLESVGSTNDLALKWAAESASDLSVIIANEQTSGRGRADRQWFTTRNSALAFSLILRPAENELKYPALFTGLGALALAQTLQHEHKLVAEIKWPNDIMVNNGKVAGILLENTWVGDRIESMVLGMGVNVLAASVPGPGLLEFPATSIENELGAPIDRLKLLHNILANMIRLRKDIGTPEFISSWEAKLAYRYEAVQIYKSSSPSQHGQLLGLNPDGSLKLQLANGETLQVHFGDVHLRPTAL